LLFSPRFAARAAPAALCCFFDFAGMPLIRCQRSENVAVVAKDYRVEAASSPTARALAESFARRRQTRRDGYRSGSQTETPGAFPLASAAIGDADLLLLRG
jgi:hypothetical protein